MKKSALVLTAGAAFALPLLFAQTLPEGKGKSLVETNCAGCHDLQPVMQHRDTKDGWQNVVDYMVSRGMAASDEDVKTIVDYLAESFPSAPKKGK